MIEDVVTVVARPNIALVKYWGKRRLGEDCADPSLNLPTNSSLSITLGSEDKLQTKTSVVFSKKFSEDIFYLDKKRQDMSDPELQERFLALNKLREIAKTNAKVMVVSENSFPTGSGMASSASGLSALVFACAKALNLKLDSSKLSEITRIGSGSACRSLYGGFVEWIRGTTPDGSDSVAKQVADESHWPEIIDIIAITSREKKKVSSRAGMKQTVATSELYKLRPAMANENVELIKKAINKKDFDALAYITMKDGMMMHATMLDTKPPILYLNDISREIIYAIEDLNAAEKKLIAAYTFDAGPNANIITLEKNREKVLGALKGINGIEKIITAKVGSGPTMMGKTDSLIESGSLKPKV